jgi:hypothetical protein
MAQNGGSTGDRFVDEAARFVRVPCDEAGRFVYEPEFATRRSASGELAGRFVADMMTFVPHGTIMKRTVERAVA